MRTETPEIKRCCFCIPLRRGLIGWGYIKLAINVVAFSYLVILLSIIWRYIDQLNTKFYVTITVVITLLAADTVFNIVFVVGGHQKSIKLLKVSYIYNIVALGLSTLGYVVKFCESLYYLYRYTQLLGFNMVFVLDVLLTACFAFVGFFVQVYIILAIRSEMVKLQKQSLQLHFSNLLDAGEPECTLQNASAASDAFQWTIEKQLPEKQVPEKQLPEKQLPEKQVPEKQLPEK